MLRGWSAARAAVAMQAAVSLPPSFPRRGVHHQSPRRGQHPPKTADNAPTHQSLNLRQSSPNGRSPDRLWRMSGADAVPQECRLPQGKTDFLELLRPSKACQLLRRHLFSHFLPEAYPDSVRPGYLRFMVWKNLAFAASSANGVLATQALLMALGLSAMHSIPAAAALNWVIKDGLGQLGGILLASRVNTLFDTNPKTWRMMAAATLQLSTGLELLTPALPMMFLPLAATANIGKNISFLAGSASSAAILRSFMRQENLGDLYAKSGAQSIASSLVGMGFGIGLGAMMANNMAVLVPTFVGLAALSILGEFACSSAVVLNTLNHQRFSLVSRAWFETGSFPSPATVAAQEVFLRPYESPFHRSSRLRLGAPLDQIPGLTRRRLKEHRRLLEDGLEGLNSVLVLSSYFAAAETTSTPSSLSSSASTARSEPSSIPTNWRRWWFRTRDWWQRLMSGGSTAWTEPGCTLPVVDLLFFRAATTEERMLGLLLAQRTRYELSQQLGQQQLNEQQSQPQIRRQLDCDAALAAAIQWTASRRHLLPGLKAAGWNTEHLVLGQVSEIEVWTSEEQGGKEETEGDKL